MLINIFLLITIVKLNQNWHSQKQSEISKLPTRCCACFLQTCQKNLWLANCIRMFCLSHQKSLKNDYSIFWQQSGRKIINSFCWMRLREDLFVFCVRIFIILGKSNVILILNVCDFKRRFTERIAYSWKKFQHKNIDSEKWWFDSLISYKKVLLHYISIQSNAKVYHSHWL